MGNGIIVSAKNNYWFVIAFCCFVFFQVRAICQLQITACFILCSYTNGSGMVFHCPFSPLRLWGTACIGLFPDLFCCRSCMQIARHDWPSKNQTLNTFITSSPRWLITFTAIRPPLGMSNGRLVSLWSVSHASSLISAFSVVFRALYGSLAPRK